MAHCVSNKSGSLKYFLHSHASHVILSIPLLIDKQKLMVMLCLVKYMQCGMLNWLVFATARLFYGD